MFAGGGVPAARDEDVQGVRDLVSFQESVLALVRDNMLEVQRAVGKYQNRVQRDVVFEVGEQVWLNSVNLSSIHFARSERKLRNPFVGPFEVLERRSEYTYRLKLTEWETQAGPSGFSCGDVETHRGGRPGGL